MTTGKRNTSAAFKRVLVVGATSSLAQAICRALARRGAELALAARDQAELELLAADLRARFGITCDTIVVDLLDGRFSPHSLMEQAGAIGAIVITAGDMGGNHAFDAGNIAYTAYINYIVPAQIATAAATAFAENKQGCIAMISSVAGDRGRQSNYAYGAAKAALSAFASGLRNRLYSSGIQVLTVKPGFVDTPMTWGMQSPLIASRDDVAEKIVSAMQERKDIIYVPWFWRYIMLVIRHIPEFVFKRLKL